MKSEKNILLAFILNLAFSVFEFVGGIFTGSVAIVSDAIHDIGDAAGIGIAYFLERKSKKKPDCEHTYGYARYSVIGSVIITLILLIGSIFVVYNAVLRIINPTEINYNGMIVFAVVGVLVNSVAALATSHGNSLNQRAVSLHMLEDVLGWIVVLVGAVVMRFTDLSIIDPLMSIAVAVFIFINAFSGLREALSIFLEKTPHGIDPHEIEEHLSEIDGIIGVHHIHIWSLDGQSNFATMHVVTNGDPHEIKEAVRRELSEHGIEHVTLELEREGEHCHEPHCSVGTSEASGHHHHHHHGHHHH